jgi:hypothetical protein
MSGNTEIHCLIPNLDEKNYALFKSVTENLPHEFQTYAKSNEKISTYIKSHIIIALQGENPVGRLVLYENNNIHSKHHKTILLGNYDCINNDAVAQVLLEQARQLADAMGYQSMIGPINGSTWENYRWITQHYHPPFFSEPNQPWYYPLQWRSFGFSTLTTYFSAIDWALTVDHPKILKKEKQLLEKGFQWQGINITQLETELKELYPIMCRGFENNYLYSPISESDFVIKYKSMKTILDPRWVIKAISPDNEIKGVIFTFPDLLQETPNRLIVKTLVIDPKDRTIKGLGSVLCNLVVREAKKMGFQSVIAALMHQQNLSNNIAKNFDSEAYHSYELLKSAWR